MRSTEVVVEAVEKSRPLSAFGQTVGSLVSKLLRPGKLKDLLSGTWIGHPAHPMLTDVPIGAWTSALILDLVGGEAAADAADTLVGVGVLAAVPTAASGLSELADLGSDPEWATAGAHALMNTTALALYAASYVARARGRRGVGVALSTAATAAMMAGAFLGGHLSFRKGVGVNHTAFEPPVEDWIPVLAEEELAEEEATLVNIGNNDVLLYRSRGTLCALSDCCTHAGGPLHEGTIQGGRVTCPWHASQFNLADGSVVRGPATAPQPAYDVRVNEGKIEVRSRT